MHHDDRDWLVKESIEEKSVTEEVYGSRAEIITDRIEARTLLPSEDLRDIMKKRADKWHEDIRYAEDSNEVISRGGSEASTLTYEQESVWSRLVRYLSHKF